MKSAQTFGPIKPIRFITDGFVDEVRKRLVQGKRIRRTLPAEGRLHIDRALPFIVVYRRPPDRADKGTEVLVKGEASYLVASGGARYRTGLHRLLRTVVTTLAEKRRAVLVIEIWSGSADRIIGGSEPAFRRPAFCIHVPGRRPPTRAAEALEDELKQVRVGKRLAHVEVVSDRGCAPVGLGALVSERDAEAFDVYSLGLEIRPIYRNPADGEVFPLTLRKLHAGVSRALKKAAFEFSLDRTDLRPTHFQALGRRVAVKAVWEADGRLAEISNRFDFLLLITPINMEEAFGRFRKRNFERQPVFYYRPRPVDPAMLKRLLYEVPIGRVEDPTLALLFREKRTELDRKLTMLEDRDTRQFRYGSYQLYGTVSDSLMQTARQLLANIPPHSREEAGKGLLGAEAFAERARQEIARYREAYSGISAGVEIRDDIVGLMVSRGNLLVSSDLQVPSSRAEALVHHEVGTHIVTYFNGRAQPFRLLHCGLAGYEELQEGLAVLAEYLIGGLSRPRLRLLAGRVLAARSLVDNATFVDTYRLLNREQGFSQRTAFTITARIHRSGGLTKDAVYLEGLVRLLDYLRNGGELNPLYTGKISASHVSVVRELQLRQILKPMPLSPRVFASAGAAERVERLRKGLSIIDLIQRRKA